MMKNYPPGFCTAIIKCLLLGMVVLPPGKRPPDHRAVEIQTEVLPVFEMPPVIPEAFDDISLKMFDLSDLGTPSSYTASLDLLCDKYESWIKEQEELAKSLEKNFCDIAQKHIENCRQCLKRMRGGIKLLHASPTVRMAFMLMNRAMLTQQLRYNLKLRKWKTNSEKKLDVEPIQEPETDNPFLKKKPI